ncbi:MAG: L-fuculose-phosphate aldolase [Mogibacterium sp.]|nr:L-fuculose-phosphate aldolase [Mogibacterium sp.]
MLMEKERNLVVEYGKKLITENLTDGTGGNISIYDPETGLMAISPSGMDYFKIQPEDIVIMNLDGEIVDGDRKPSSEKDLHIEMYKAKPGMTAAVHTHAMFCTTLACMGTPIYSVHYVLADAATDVVPVTPYVTYGTKELALAAVETIGEGKATLLANHGFISIGKDINDAFGIARECEWVAQIQWRTMCVGKPNILDREEMERVMVKFQSYGQVKAKK